MSSPRTHLQRRRVALATAGAFYASVLLQILPARDALAKVNPLYTISQSIKKANMLIVFDTSGSMDGVPGGSFASSTEVGVDCDNGIDCRGGGTPGTCAAQPGLLCTQDLDCRQGNCGISGEVCATAAQCPGVPAHCNDDPAFACINDADCSGRNGTCSPSGDACGAGLPACPAIGRCQIGNAVCSNPGGDCMAMTGTCSLGGGTCDSSSPTCPSNRGNCLHTPSTLCTVGVDCAAVSGTCLSPPAPAATVCMTDPDCPGASGTCNVGGAACVTVATCTPPKVGLCSIDKVTVCSANTDCTAAGSLQGKCAYGGAACTLDADCTAQAPLSCSLTATACATEGLACAAVGCSGTCPVQGRCALHPEITCSADTDCAVTMCSDPGDSNDWIWRECTDASDCVTGLTSVRHGNPGTYGTSGSGDETSCRAYTGTGGLATLATHCVLAATCSTGTCSDGSNSLDRCTRPPNKCVLLAGTCAASGAACTATCPNTGSTCNLDGSACTGTCPNARTCSTSGAACTGTGAGTCTSVCSVSGASCTGSCPTAVTACPNFASVSCTSTAMPTGCPYWVKRSANQRNRNCDPSNGSGNSGTTFGACTYFQGYCSSNKAFACNTDADCASQGGGTCTLGSTGPATAPKRCDTAWWACTGDSDCFGGDNCTATNHAQTWTLDVCPSGAQTCNAQTCGGTCSVDATACTGTCANVANCSNTGVTCTGGGAGTCATVAHCSLTAAYCASAATCSTVGHCSLSSTTECDGTHACPTASYCNLDTTTECDGTHPCPNVQYCSLSATTDCDGTHACPTASYCSLDTTTECDATHACSSVGHCSLAGNDCNGTHPCGTASYCALDTTTECDATHACPAVSYCNVLTAVECDATHACGNYAHCSLTTTANCNASNPCGTASYCNLDTTTECDATHACPNIGHCTTLGTNCDATHACGVVGQTCSVTGVNCDVTACGSYVRRCSAQRNRNCDLGLGGVACGGTQGACTAYTGRCSGNKAYACNSNADCGGALGTCSSGAPGSAPARCNGNTASGNRTYACTASADCDVISVGNGCNTGTAHGQTWTATTCGGGAADTCGALTFAQTCTTGVTHAQTCGALTLTQTCTTGVTHAQACTTGVTHSQTCSALTFAQACSTGVTHGQACSGASHAQACAAMTHTQTCSGLMFTQTCAGAYAQTCTVGATTQTCAGATAQTCGGGTPQACNPSGTNTCQGGTLQSCSGATAGTCNAATTNTCVQGTNVCSVGTNQCVAAANDCSTTGTWCVPSTLGDTCNVPNPTDVCNFSGAAQPSLPLRMCQLAMTRCSTDANCTAIAGDACGPSTSRTVIAKRAVKRVVLESYSLVNFGLMTFYQGGYFPYYLGTGTTSRTIVEFQPRDKLAALGCWSAGAGPSATCVVNTVSYTLRSIDNSRYESFLGGNNYLHEDVSWSTSPVCTEYCNVTAGRGRYEGSYYQYTITTGSYTGAANPQTTYTGKTRSISGNTYVYYNSRPDYYNGGASPPLSFPNCGSTCTATCGGRWDSKLAPFMDPAASGATATANAVSLTAALDKASYGGVVTYFGTPTGCTLRNAVATAGRSNSAYHYMADVKNGNVGAGVPADTLACRNNFVLLLTDGEANGPGDQSGGNSCTSTACNTASATDATWNAACTCRAIKSAWEMQHDLGVKTFVVGFGGDVAATGTQGAIINNNIARAGGTTSSLTAINEAQLLTALNNAIFTAIAGNYSTSPASAAQGTQQISGCGAGQGQCINFGSYILDARVNFPAWSGVFSKYNLDAAGNVTSTVEASARLRTRDWKARQIYTSDLSTSPPTLIKVLVDASTGAISNAGKLYNLGLGTNATEAARITQWLLGNPTQANAVLLGAIVNSTPIDVGAPGRSPLPGGVEFFAAQAARKNLIYVGADDGMLHAFYASDPDGGGALREMDEAFAYLPPDLLPTITQLYANGGQLALPSNHLFGLASSPKAKNICTAGCDVYNASTTTWKTMLLLGEGFGGNEIFALDITSPFDPSGALFVDGSPNGTTGAVSTAPFSLLWHSDKVQTSGSNYNATMGRAISVPAFYYNKTAAKDDYRVIFASGYKTGSGSAEGRTVINARAADGTFLDSDAVNANGSCTQEFTLLTDIATAKNYAQNPGAGTTEEGKLLAAYPADTHGRVWRYNPVTGALAQVVDLGCQQPLHFAPAVVQLDRDNYQNHAGEVFIAGATNSPLDVDTTGFAGSQIYVFAESVNQTDGSVATKTTFGSSGLLLLDTGPTGQICAVQAADGTCTTRMPVTARPLGTPSAVLKSAGTSFEILTTWYVPPADTACGKGQSYLTVHEFVLDGSTPATQLGGVALGTEPVTNPVFVGGKLFQVTGSGGAAQITSGLGASFTPGITAQPAVAGQNFRSLGWLEKDN